MLLKMFAGQAKKTKKQNKTQWKENRTTWIPPGITSCFYNPTRWIKPRKKRLIRKFHGKTANLSITSNLHRLVLIPGIREVSSFCER